MQRHHPRPPQQPIDLLDLVLVLGDEDPTLILPIAEPQRRTRGGRRGRHHQRQSRRRQTSGTDPGVETIDGAGSPGSNGFALEPPSEIVGEGAGAGVAVSRILGHGHRNDGLEIFRGPGDHQAEAERFLVEDLFFGLGSGRTVERRLFGEHRIESRPKAPDINPVVDGAVVVTDLLGSHEGGRPHGHRRGAIIVGLTRFVGDTEIEHIGMETPVRSPLDHDVAGLEVSVDYAQGVRRLDRPRDLLENLELLLEIELAGEISKGLTIDELHGDKPSPAPLSDFEYTAHVFVIEARLGLCFDLETFDLAGFARTEELEGHGALELAVDGTVDHTHPTFADEIDDGVAIPARGGVVKRNVDDRTLVGSGFFIRWSTGHDGVSIADFDGRRQAAWDG